VSRRSPPADGRRRTAKQITIELQKIIFMKKYLSLGLIVAIILFFGANKVVLAEDNAGSDNANANVNVGVNNANANAGQKMIKGFGNRVMQIGNRVEKIVAQLKKHQERIVSFIADLEVDGKDVTAANEQLNLSISSLASAQSSFRAAKGIVTGIDLTQIGNKEYIKGIKESFKIKMKEAKESLKESRIYLKDTIKEIKNLRNPENSDSDNNDDSNQPAQ